MKTTAPTGTQAVGLVLPLLLLLLLPIVKRQQVHTASSGAWYYGLASCVSKYNISPSTNAASARPATRLLPRVNGQLSDPLHSLVDCRSVKGRLAIKYQTSIQDAALGQWSAIRPTSLLISLTYCEGAFRDKIPSPCLRPRPLQ